MCAANWFVPDLSNDFTISKLWRFAGDDMGKQEPDRQKNRDGYVVQPITVYHRIDYAENERGFRRLDASVKYRRQRFVSECDVGVGHHEQRREYERMQESPDEVEEFSKPRLGILSRRYVENNGNVDDSCQECEWKIVHRYAHERRGQFHEGDYAHEWDVVVSRRSAKIVMNSYEGGNFLDRSSGGSFYWF